MTAPNLTEHVVDAVYDHLCRINGEWQPIGPNDIKEVLTAALPFLPVQGAVKKLEWHNVDAVCAWCYAKTPIGEYRVTWSFNESGQKLHYPDGTTKQFDGAGYGDREAAKAAAQADYSARILSALEPTAARELALEEAAQVAEQFRNKDWIAHDMRTGVFPKQSEPGIAIAAAIRSLAHADAGKVEGDGEKWPMRELIAKAMAYQSVGDPHAKTVHGNQRWEWFVEDADKFINAFGYYLPALPSAPASEGAE